MGGGTVHKFTKNRQLSSSHRWLDSQTPEMCSIVEIFRAVFLFGGLHKSEMGRELTCLVLVFPRFRVRQSVVFA